MNLWSFQRSSLKERLPVADSVAVPGVELELVDDHLVHAVVGNKLKEPLVHLFNVVASVVSELFNPEENIAGEVFTSSDSTNSDNARFQQNQNNSSSQVREQWFNLRQTPNLVQWNA